MSKRKWETYNVDENVVNNPDWVKCYTIALPNVPLIPNKGVLDFFHYIQTLDGYYGIRPEYPRGTLVIFDTENNAKGARNLIRAYKGYNGKVGDNICEIYIPKEYATYVNRNE